MISLEVCGDVSSSVCRVYEGVSCSSFLLLANHAVLSQSKSRSLVVEEEVWVCQKSCLKKNVEHFKFCTLFARVRICREGRDRKEKDEARFTGPRGKVPLPSRKHVKPQHTHAQKYHFLPFFISLSAVTPE
jgi:hypothetical protein